MQIAGYTSHSSHPGAVQLQSMESTSRIFRYVRGYDPGFISKFRCPSLSRRIVGKSHRSAGDSRLQGTTKSRIVCCPQVSPGNSSLLADCFSQKEDNGELPSDELCQVTDLIGGIVALGKFDALHIGHRELAIHASKAGNPYLLSFVGIAEVLGWEHRVPIVAKCDRKRVLSSWAPYCGNIIPLEYHVEFSSVRHLTPQQFVERLSKELRVSGVVAGENYRFGYKASGNATELVRLCKQYGLEAYIVSPVMDRRQLPPSIGSKAENSMEMGQVSSTRVRHALASGDMEYVSDLLGRSHRLVLTADQRHIDAGQRMSASKSCMLNQPPKDGLYESCTLLADDAVIGSCNVLLDTTHIHIDLDEVGPQTWDPFLDCQTLGIEFGVSHRLR